MLRKRRWGRGSVREAEIRRTDSHIFAQTRVRHIALRGQQGVRFRGQAATLSVWLPSAPGEACPLLRRVCGGLSFLVSLSSMVAEEPRDVVQGHPGGERMPPRHFCLAGRTPPGLGWQPVQLAPHLDRARKEGALTRPVEISRKQNTTMNRAYQ